MSVCYGVMQFKAYIIDIGVCCSRKHVTDRMSVTYTERVKIFYDAFLSK